MVFFSGGVRIRFIFVEESVEFRAFYFCGLRRGGIFGI